MHVGVYLLLHVVILVVHLYLAHSGTVLLVDFLGTLTDEHLALLETGAVVVADDVGELCLLDIGLYAEQVVETLVALGGLRGLVGGQHGCELSGHPVGIDHLALGIARMHTHALETHFGTCGIEVFILQLAQVATVDSVGPLATEFLHIEVMGAHTYLLVRVEAHTYVAMLYLIVVAQEAHGLHNLGYAGFVVGAQQRGAVGHNEVLTLMGREFGKLGRRGDDAR